MNEFFTNFFVKHTYQDTYNTLTYNKFDQHIQKSIPKYKKTQLLKIKHIIKKPKGNLLDIGGTTGAFCKTVSIHSNINTKNIDTNAAALNYSKLFTVKNYKIINKDIMQHKNKKYDVINASMTLQFINKNRSQHIEHIVNLLANDGELFIDEKVYTNNFYAKELLNNIRKLKYFTAKQVYKKFKIINNLNKNIVKHELLVALLSKHFRHIVCYYNESNFVGYYATNNTINYRHFKTMI